VGVAVRHDERAEAAHLLMQEADRIRFGVVRAEGVGADELRETVGLVGIGAAHRAHLVEHHGHTGLRDLPGGFGAREPAADDVNGFDLGHAP
jgi:hypothetical protein